MISAQCTGFLNTPPLWKGEQLDVQQFAFPSLSLPNFEPQPIPVKLRLGHQIEHIYKQLIDYTDDYDILLHNLPVLRDKITLGEIDFILKEKSSNTIIHVELTYKFYIIDPTFSQPIHQLIGPNRRDSFYDKMQKIKHKQIPLLHTDEAIQALSEKDINHRDIVHQCCFKAQLFQPYGQHVDLGTLNTDCIVGQWLQMTDFHKPSFISAQYYIPTKSEWVIEPHDGVSWQVHETILADLTISLEQNRSPMLWMKSSDGTHAKLFVVWW